MVLRQLVLFLAAGSVRVRAGGGWVCVLGATIVSASLVAILDFSSSFDEESRRRQRKALNSGPGILRREEHPVPLGPQPWVKAESVSSLRCLPETCDSSRA